MECLIVQDKKHKNINKRIVLTKNFIKMEDNYNWELILKFAAPAALAVAIIFYLNISNGWKWFSLIAGLSITGFLIYRKDKKKGNIFTAVGIVFLIALVVRILKNFGFI